jgi:hypothetical protein
VRLRGRREWSLTEGLKNWAINGQKQTGGRERERERGERRRERERKGGRETGRQGGREREGGSLTVRYEREGHNKY